MSPPDSRPTSSDALFASIVESGVLVDIAQQAADEYPGECCGVLVRDGVRLRSVPFENIQDKLHALDPERFTRTSRTAYNMNTLKLERLRSEQDLRVIYHSHVDCDAYFSEEDVRGATAPDTGEPVMPGVDYLVMSIYDRTPRAANLFRYSAATGRYEKVAGAELTSSAEPAPDAEPAG